MFLKYCKIIPRALVMLGILFGLFLVNPACYAGSAAILVPNEDRDVPEGSQIPEWRIMEIENKVMEYHKMMKRQNTAQQQERLPENESTKPIVSKEP